MEQKVYLTPVKTQLLTYALLLIAFYIFVLDAYPRAMLDFSVYYQAALRLVQGENIYQYTYLVVDRWGRKVDSYYFYPPFLAHVLSKFLYLGPVGIKFVWCLLGFGSWVGTAYCCTLLAERSFWKGIGTDRLFLLLLFFLACFEPLYAGISDGQVNALVLLLLSVFMLGTARRREIWAGVALGLAILIKIGPALLLLAVVRHRRWRTLFAAAATCVGLSLLTLLDLHSPQVFIDSWASFGHLIDDQSRRDFTFNFVFDRALLAPFGLDTSLLARSTVKVGILVGSIVMAACMPQKREKGELFLIGALLALMIVSSPILWFQHLVWAFLPLLILSTDETVNGTARLRHLTLCLGFYFALSQTNLAQYWALKIDSPLIAITSLLPGVLLISLAAVLCVRGRRQP